MPSRLGGFTFKSNKCFMSAWRSSKCSRLRISAHNINRSIQLKNLAPKTWITQREVGESSRDCQKVIKIVRKQQPIRVGWSAFYRESEKLAVGAVRLNRLDWSTIPVRPVRWPQLGFGHSLKESLWIGKFGLGPGHIWLWPDLSGGAQIPTVILFTGLD
jgi:hypothetical protein